MSHIRTSVRQPEITDKTDSSPQICVVNKTESAESQIFLLPAKK